MYVYFVLDLGFLLVWLFCLFGFGVWLLVFLRGKSFAFASVLGFIKIL